MTDDQQSTVRYEVKDRKAYLTLNRPDRLNAIDFRMPGTSPPPSAGPTTTPACTSSCSKGRAGPSAPDTT